MYHWQRRPYQPQEQRRAHVRVEQRAELGLLPVARHVLVELGAATCGAMAVNFAQPLRKLLDDSPQQGTVQSATVEDAEQVVVHHKTFADQATFEVGAPRARAPAGVTTRAARNVRPRARDVAVRHAR